MNNETDVFYDVVMIKNIKTKEEAISYLANHLHEKGYVNENYGLATIERELTYPTALPTKPIGIAVPHSVAENVIKQAVVLGITDNFVEFNEMGNEDSKVNVGIIFLLALKGENNHLNYLRNIVNYCKVEANVTRLYEAKSVDEANKIFKCEILNTEK
ncbi:PTS sugar transporter subunit IIA [Clostridium algoriphilum]|uniref:PTS sugar transporter subunit IIA n=1 Tax=Clostridium algoriphilum TaxID=198347 RepID=UPI001CF21833|nr:PTS sugar transporter subunit IIA [Clostridium algoriphilum]MCB2293624.1 PTS sugar transporter subunit IIA [Clostridium algoriphilum]